MSVPKSRRGESPAEYINLAREIYVFTYNRVRILPKSYTFYFSLPLYNAARKGVKHMKDKLSIFRRWVDKGRMTAADIAASLVSWLGHMRRFHGHYVVQSVLRKYRELFALEVKNCGLLHI